MSTNRHGFVCGHPENPDLCYRCDRRAGDSVHYRDYLDMVAWREQQESRRRRCGVNPIESTVGLLSEHPAVFVATVAVAGWAVLAAVLAVAVGRLIALAEFEDIDVELQVVR